MDASQGTLVYERNTGGYTTVETLLDDVSRQMASSNLSRYSRGSSGQKMGGSIRVVKPSSTSNSPRGSIGLGRRRTVMTDSPYRRRIAMADQKALAFGSGTSTDGLQSQTRTNRPVSWHPSSHLAPQPVYCAAYPIPRPDLNNEFKIFDLPPTPAPYSGYTSPESTFSPLSIPFAGYEQHQFPHQDTSTSYPSNLSYPPYQQMNLVQQVPNYEMASVGDMDPSLYSHFDWSNFVTNGFESSTAPPTPDSFLPIQHPDLSFPAEEAIPFHSLSDSEADGEELIGMGLYDNPETAKSSSLDPQLDNYRASMISQLLGSAQRRNEPTGKGLKLEETWNPPPSDDEEDEEDDDEQDGEGEDDDELVVEETKNSGEEVSSEVTAKNAATAQSNFFLPDGINFVPDTIQANHATQGYDRNGWL